MANPMVRIEKGPDLSYDGKPTKRIPMAAPIAAAKAGTEKLPYKAKEYIVPKKEAIITATGIIASIGLR